jgi:opacity protein-like surface antigen
MTVKPSLCIVLTLASLALPAAAAAQAAGPTLADLAFMSGCWRGDFAEGTLEEYYTTPSENLILGTSRYLRSGRAVQHEFSRITADSTGIVLLPFPGGLPSEHEFRLTTVDDGTALFEAPEHDFPRRIRYTREADGSLSARIDGGEGSERIQEWHMRAVPCRQPQ